MNPQTQISQKYREQQVQSAGPVERLLIVYDVALLACAKRDLERLSRALGVLVEGLNFEYAEIANRLLAIYQWCGELGRKKQYEEAAGILRELRETWTVVTQQQSAPVASALTARAAMVEARAGAWVA
jgi:flagellin-specific chaperone FliS